MVWKKKQYLFSIVVGEIAHMDYVSSIDLHILIHKLKGNGEHYLHEQQMIALHHGWRKGQPAK